MEQEQVERPGGPGRPWGRSRGRRTVHRLSATMSGCLLAAALLACSPGDDDPGAVAPAPVTSPDRSGSGALADRCLSLMPTDREIAPLTITDSGMRLAAALVAPPADRATIGVLMLPQIGAAGLCGWLRYAAVLADRGVVALPLDPCGYGESDCDPERSIREQVDAASRYLRDVAGVDSVVLVGASMGGSQTVRAVAQGAEVQAWVDVSGPSAWEGERLLGLSDAVRSRGLPGLVVRARRDGPPAEFDRARVLAERVAARFVPAPVGHGWDLLLAADRRLSSTGAAVARFVCTHGGSARERQAPRRDDRTPGVQSSCGR